jgi:histidinol-phosphatase (PHP family)
MADSCQAAIAAGVTEIAFTDHIDHEPVDIGFNYWRAEAYFRELEACRQAFGDRLTILSGAEVDFNARIAPRVERFLAAHDFDFVIGSVHYTIEGELIFPDHYAGRTLESVFAAYFRQILLAIETGWFDTIGHLDLPKRYAPASHRHYDPLAFRAALAPIFAALIARGTSFEINTSGLRRATSGASLPGPAIVRWYVEAGGRLITTGTDSHAAATVGAGLATTLDMLRLCGISDVSSFRRRVRSSVPITDSRAAGPRPH